MRHLLKDWGIMCTTFLCCCRRKLLGCLAPQSSAWSSLLADHLFQSPRNHSSAIGAGTGTRSARARSGGGRSTALSGGPCCEASPGSTWSGWGTRPACSWSAGLSWQGARPAAPAGKSRERSRPRLRPASQRRAAPARCGPTPGARRHFRRGLLRPVSRGAD